MPRKQFPALARPVPLVIRLTTRLKRALVTLGLRIKRLFVSAPTAEELRETDQARQREIRRELRGLEPETTPPKQ